MGEINVAMIGQGFMGRTHSNAWSQLPRFFKPPVSAAMHTVFGRDAAGVQAFAKTWGWRHASTDWKAAVADPAIDLVDVVTPNNMHAEVSLAALKAGKHVACEKPIARTIEEARLMVAAAREAKGKTFIWYNYRRCPAVATAYKLVQSGAIGTVRHVRAFYLQDWADETIPLIWRFQKEGSGAGSHGDLNAHIIDMVRFVTGEEITEIAGAIAETFIKERKLVTGPTAGGIAAGVGGADKTGPVTVDDAVLFLARTSGGGVASFEAARQATGNQNRNGFEINGSKGALKFDFERMNELQFYDATRPRAVQGWTTIMCTHGGDHPYAENWWPDAHVLGYEHGFTNQAYDILRVLGGQEPVVPIPDFEDAYQTQRVLEAAIISAVERRPVSVSEVR
ncbi:Gfo/Idh/MocA family protein [Paludisphaera mucosa]|uniref:Gfo/Idh/MocA family oxidoreductase n=1 Tax=Paludisphaera mucosa TaxID=3030827 RepID=A0ABT6FGX8_9BACT|nr:Gfo/Idh/MocA family oxidoreductase [Paludisphaera mucosa]MDG3006797.1 Gfo/Idh/MocA family oxidoreductase [Paludisphaera mucosa]